MSFAEVDNVQSPRVRLNHVRRGSGEPLVLLHGIGDTLAAWTPAAELLAREHEVIAVDLPGFGRSLRLRDAEPTPANLARAVIDFMGGERFHVAGNSLGGGIAFEIGKAGHALSVTGLSPIGFQRGWERAWLRTMLAVMRTAGGSVPPAALALHPVRHAAAWLVMDRPRPRAVLESGLHDLRISPGWEETVPPTVAYTFSGAGHVPVTIAWAEHDRLLLPWQAKRARAALPDARHVTLTGCGHLPAWDDPRQVADAILGATRSPRPREPAAARAATRR
jgi:pimeloyl-ACP methyl ester carboxylesterase